jgi:NADH-quinone oxidoreductase subunit N
VFAISSIVIGAVGAIDQFKIKRFIGFTTINQMGFILLGMGLNNIYGFISSYIYLCIYITLNLIFFSFILHIKSKDGRELVYMSDLVPFFKDNRLASIVFIILLFSLAGMPPTIGFYMKLLVLKALVVSGYVKLMLFVLYFNIVSIFYYIRIIKIIFFDSENLVFYNKKKELSLKKESKASFTMFKNPISDLISIDALLKDKVLLLKLFVYIVYHIIFYGLILFFIGGV